MWEEQATWCILTGQPASEWKRLSRAERMAFYDVLTEHPDWRWGA